MSLHRSLLIVASSFPPSSEAGVHRTLRFARYLPSFGWEVHVLTMAPQWYGPDTPVDERLLEKIPDDVHVARTAAVYPLNWATRVRRQRRQAGTENRNGCAGRSPSEPTAEKSLFQQLKETVSLRLTTPDRHIGWIPFAVPAGRRLIRRECISAIYSSGPPWTNHLVGYRLKQATGKPWVADFRDPWIGASDVRPIRKSDTWAGRRHRQLERRVIEGADHVIVNTPQSRDDFFNRYGEDVAGKFTVIPNGFDPADYDGLAIQTSTRQATKLTIAHAGSFYATRNVNGLVDAAGHLCRARAVPPGGLEIRLIGALRPGRFEEEARIEAAGAEDVITLTPRVPHHECLRQLNEADILLLVQVGTPLCVPGKVFEYIALSKPMLVLADSGATTDFVQQERLGVCIRPHDVPAIENALTQLYQQFITGDGLPQISVETRDRYDGRSLTAELDTLLRMTIDRQSALHDTNSPDPRQGESEQTGARGVLP